MSHDNDPAIPDDLNECIKFHGHLCPGLVYGYRVAKEALRLLDIGKADDEEIVVVSENDSCAVDGFQKILGTTAGKGNLIVRDYGKNVYTVFSRKARRAVRFSRIFEYRYQGEHPDEFDVLEKAVSDKTATPAEMKRQKYLKSMDLATKQFNEIFNTSEVNYEELPYAPLAPSKTCVSCGELTMKTKMVDDGNGKFRCVPCSTKI